MKIIGKYYKHFISRGLIAMGFGPIVLAVVYGILGFTNVVNQISTSELFLGVLTLSALAFLAGGIIIAINIP